MWKFFFALITKTTGEDVVDVDTFITGCLHMKGFASVIDVLSLQFQVTTLKDSLEKEFIQLKEILCCTHRPVTASCV